MALSGSRFGPVTDQNHSLDAGAVLQLEMNDADPRKPIASARNPAVVVERQPRRQPFIHHHDPATYLRPEQPHRVPYRHAVAPVALGGCSMVAQWLHGGCSIGCSTVAHGCF